MCTPGYSTFSNVHYQSSISCAEYLLQMKLYFHLLFRSRWIDCSVYSKKRKEKKKHVTSYGSMNTWQMHTPPPPPNHNAHTTVNTHTHMHARTHICIYTHTRTHTHTHPPHTHTHTSQMSNQPDGSRSERHYGRSVCIKSQVVNQMKSFSKLVYKIFINKIKPIKNQLCLCNNWALKKNHHKHQKTTTLWTKESLKSH